MVPPALATLEQVPEGVVLRCYVGHFGWIAHFLAGLDCPMILRQPLELRDALLGLAERITAVAERTGEQLFYRNANGAMVPSNVVHPGE